MKVRRVQTADAHLHVDPLFGLFAIKQAFNVEVGRACVLLNGGSDPFPLARDDDVGINS